MAVQYNSTQYDRIRALGKGSFGTATVHRRRADCSLVVLKEIDLQRFKGEREKMSAINEARIMSTLSHVNIIKYHNAYTTDTKLIIEMEYASVGTLAAYLTFQMQPLEEREILVIFRQITSGVYYLHSKDIVHLDLKMTNIFVTIEGFVKIGDFGISQYMNNNSIRRRTIQQVGAGQKNNSQNVADNHSTKLPTSNSHLGTLAYSSPERCLGEATDFKSDIWSLGCILYELITSKPLFTGSCLPDLVLSITRIQYTPIKRNIMPAIIETFEQTIARDPDERPSAKELLCITGQLLSLLRLDRRNKMGNKRQNHHRFELSTELALFAGGGGGHNQDDMGQLNYLHSLVYQVRLGTNHIQVDRVNLPQAKRIKEICKGKSHYLVLTYDNIVYGWGSKTYGQLGACGLSSSSSYTSVSASGRAITRSARSSLNAREWNSTTCTAASSPTSSTQTIATATLQATTTNNKSTSSNQHLSKQLVMSMLEQSQPTTRPFILNELNHRKIIQVAAGNNFSVFLSRTGIVMTCGDGSSGCLGRGDMSSSFTPCMVESLLNADVVCIGCGPQHVVAVCGNGKVFSWGNSGQGRLGLAAAANAATTSITSRGATSKATTTHSKLDDDPDSISLGPPLSHETRAGKYVLRPEPIQFEANVFIKGVFCGDRCTVFIDSDNRCWACGENRFNKLGLDIRRRFKKNLIVDRCCYPTEIQALSKYKIVSCNIGKNHSTFISSEGKLLVFGQDIDHTYRLRNNIISSRDSHRRITSELQIRRLNSPPLKLPPAPVHCHIPQTSCYNSHNLQSVASRGMLTSLGVKLNHSRLTTNHQASKLSISNKLSKLQRQQVESCVKKSRSNKKMPFDCTISVGCRPKFTLALTNDNRVYFWGIRSHKKEEIDHLVCPASLTEVANSNWKRNESIEPQLVSNCSDECFIKIGGTNNSLMSNIEMLGSDQPIIHAQDPRLRAKSLADLWILDYQPSRRSSSISSTSSCCSTASCSQCHSLSSVGDLTPPCQPQTRQPQLLSYENDESSSYIEDCMRHDAILEPQPIVSLYVPSMFNHNGCSLNLVDLFCFDDDRFYLILDTSIKLQQPQAQGSSRPPSGLASGFHSPNATNSRKRLMSVNETAKCQIRQLAPNESLSLVNLHQATSGTPLRKLDVASSGLPPPPPVAAPFEQEKSTGSIELEFEGPVVGNDDARNSGLEFRNCPAVESDKVCQLKIDSCDDDENNNHSISSHNITNDHTLISTSQGGVSLEEPRSLSTFATSLGNHIIVGPTMRSSEQEQALHPLTFGSHRGQRQRLGRHIGQNEVHLERASESNDGEIKEFKSGLDSSDKLECCASPVSNYLMVGRRKRANKSESTTNCVSNDIEETSSMPSWVRNEYMEQQHEAEVVGEDEDHTSEQIQLMFRLGGGDSSVATDNDTCMSGISLEISDTYSDHDEKDAATDDHESDQTLAHDIASIVEDEEDIRLGKKCDNSTPDRALAEAQPTPGCSDTINLNKVQVTLADGLDDDEEPKALEPDKRAKSLVFSRSHPNISELNQEVCSDLLRRASILDDKQHEATNGPVNILDCNVYKASGVHNNKIQNTESQSHNKESIVYDNNTLHQSQLSGNMLNSALSSLSNSHNPLIRPDSSSKSSGRNKQSKLQRDNHTNLASQLQDRNSYSENPYSWPKLEGDSGRLDNGQSSVINRLYQPTTGDRSLVKEMGGRFPAGGRLSLSRRQSVTTDQLNEGGIMGRPTMFTKTRATSSSSLSSIRKSLVKLFC